MVSGCFWGDAILEGCNDLESNPTASNKELKEEQAQLKEEQSQFRDTVLMIINPKYRQGLGGGWRGEGKLDVGRILDKMELMSRHMLADCQKSQ